MGSINVKERPTKKRRIETGIVFYVYPEEEANESDTETDDETDENSLSVLATPKPETSTIPDKH